MLRRELWLRVKLDDIDGIRIGVLAVDDNDEVIVSEGSIAALWNDGESWTDEEDGTWTVKYPIIAEALESKGYRKWDEATN